MLTSQQIEMLEKLPDLLKRKMCELDDIRVGYSYTHRFFFKCIIPRYLENENSYQAEFMSKTGLGKDVFQELRGGKKEVMLKREATLMRLAFGLGVSYEEAFLLFWFAGKNLLTDDPIMGGINKILLELDSDRTKRLKPCKRLALLGDLMKKESINLK